MTSIEKTNTHLKRIRHGIRELEKWLNASTEKDTIEEELHRTVQIIHRIFLVHEPSCLAEEV
jgi:hypothetical protein